MMTTTAIETEEPGAQREQEGIVASAPLLGQIPPPFAPNNVNNNPSDMFALNNQRIAIIPMYFPIPVPTPAPQNTESHEIIKLLQFMYGREITLKDIKDLHEQGFTMHFEEKENKDHKHNLLGTLYYYLTVLAMGTWNCSSVIGTIALNKGFEHLDYIIDLVYRLLFDD